MPDNLFLPDIHQKDFDKEARRLCSDTKCFLSRHMTCEGEVHIRHNTDCLPILQEWINNPEVDIWGAKVRPWIEASHAR
jgi:hypothetical protein